MFYFKLILAVCSLAISFGFAQTIPAQHQIVANKDTLKMVSKPELKFNDPWFAIDKGQHLVGSMIITIGTASTMNKFMNTNKSDSKIYGAGFSFFIGVGKEVWDSSKVNNRFSYKDLCANVAGIVLGLAILNLE